MVTIRFLVPLSAVLIFISSCATGKPIVKFYMVHDFKGTQEFHADKMRCHAWAKSQVPNLVDEAYSVATIDPLNPLGHMTMAWAAAEQRSIYQKGYNQCLAANGWRNKLFYTLGWLGGGSTTRGPSGTYRTKPNPFGGGWNTRR